MRDGWVETKLGGICEIYQPKTIAKSLMNDSGNYIVYGANGPIGRFDEYNHENSEVVVTCRGATCGTVNKTPQKTWITGNAMVIRPKNNSLLKDFLFLSLTSYVDLKSCISGSAQPQITREGLSPQKIFIPPLAEQKRIVDVISSVDSYIEGLEQQVDKARKSRNAILHELLIKGGDGWKNTSLSQICLMIKRGQAPSYTDEKSVKVLNQKCIRNGKLNFEFSRQTDSNVKPISDWAYIQSVDSLINSTGVGTLGRTAFVGELNEPATVDSHVTIVRPNLDKVYPPFLGMTLNFRESDIESLATGSSGQTELSRDALGNLNISIPPLAEQKRIVEIISVFDNQIEALDSTIAKTKNLRSALLSDLLSGNHEIPMTYDKLIGAA